MCKEDNDKIGYGKPPKNSRFQKGKSGNPKGRPQKNKNDITSLLYKTFEERIVIKKGDQKIRASKFEITIEQIVNSCMKGNLPAIRLILPYILLNDRNKKAEERILIDEKSKHEEQSKVQEDTIKSIQKIFEQIRKEKTEGNTSDRC